MRFEDVSSKVDFAALDGAMNDTWDRERTFQRSIESRSGGNDFVFYDGPPFATGLPHYGHLLASTIKDIVPRYHTMRGSRVERRFGWDCHGLPVEFEMEKQLQLSSRRDIETYGIAQFNEACRGIVLRYTGEWRKTIRRLGRWVDFDHDYKTMDPAYMESIWWVFHRLWDRGLVYEGFKVMPYCPRCATPLSNFETAQGYQDVQDPAITVAFTATDATRAALGTDRPLAFLAWTTTPWTLPSNLALAVGADIEYVQVRTEERDSILARERLPAYAKEFGDAEIVATFPGRKLDGLSYVPLLPFFAAHEARGAFRVRLGDFVSTADGTGIVHAAPGFGEDDYALGRRHDLPVVCPIDADGRFTSEVADWAGQFVKDADSDIVRRLKTDGALVKRDTIQHSYPHCYRCDAPLLYRAITTWFVRVEEIKPSMLRANQTVRWVPSHLRDGRFGKWLEGARDWAISRNRYWGTPLPVWRCDTCKRDHCIGSVAELEGLAGVPVHDLHKHFVDSMTFPCSCGQGIMRRVSEVLDCWFESGAMPYAQCHYPFENRERFEANFPAEFIAEGIDQTRGWFYTLIVLSSALFDKSAFRNVVVNGLVLAEDGKKMSKRLKNYPEPEVLIDRYGADALRLYMMNSAAVRGDNLRFSESGVQDVLRSIVLPLWNAYAFFVTYANVDGWEPAVAAGSTAAGSDPLTRLRPTAASRSHQLDRWILSAQQRLVRVVTESMEAYELQRAIEPIVRFVDDLTNWYVRRSRRRFWKSADDQDKRQAYETLYAVLLDTCRILAPYTPFVTDVMYRNLIAPVRDAIGAPDSVHLCDWPASLPGEEDRELDDRMDIVIRTVSMGRALRTAHTLKVRQPLRALHVATRDARARAAIESMADQVREELNVKSIVFDDREDDLVTFVVKANFKSLGPRLGKKMQLAAKAIAALPVETVLAVEAGATHDLDIEGTTVTLGAADVIVERHEKQGLFVECKGALTVALDPELTPELVAEGMAREFVNRVQNLRKEAGFKVADRIHIRYRTESGELAAALAQHADTVRGETLATTMELVTTDPPAATPADINGHGVALALERVEAPAAETRG